MTPLIWLGLLLFGGYWAVLGMRDYWRYRRATGDPNAPPTLLDVLRDLPNYLRTREGGLLGAPPTPPENLETHADPLRYTEPTVGAGSPRPEPAPEALPTPEPPPIAASPVSLSPNLSTLAAFVARQYRALFIGGLAALFVGQYLLAHAPIDGNSLMGWLLLVAGGGALALTATVCESARWLSSETNPGDLRQSAFPVVQLTGLARWGIVGGLALALVLTQLRAQSYQNFFVFIWLGSVILLGGLMGVWDTRNAVPLSPNLARWDALWLAGLTLLGLLIALYRLQSLPAMLMGDEGVFWTTARDIANGVHKPALFDLGVAGFPALGSIYQAQIARWFGMTLWAWRFSSVLAGVATIVPLYLLARELFERRVAIVASALFIAAPFFLAFARMGYTTILALFPLTLALYWAYLGLKRSSAFYLFAAGCAAGLGFYTSPAGRSAVVIIGLFMLVRLAQESRKAGQWFIAALVFGGGWFSVAAPQLLYLSGKDSNTLLGLLAPEIFADQANYVSGLLRSLLALHNPNLVTQHFLAAPLAGTLGAMTYFIGLALSVIGWRQRRNQYLLLWFGLTLLVFSAATGAAPHDRNLVALLPLLALWSGAGLVALLDAAQPLTSVLPARAAQLALVAVTVIVAGAGLYDYFYRVPQAYHPDFENIIGWAGLNAQGTRFVYVYGDPTEANFMPYVLREFSPHLRYETVSVDALIQHQIEMPADQPVVVFYPLAVDNAAIAASSTYWPILDTPTVFHDSSGAGIGGAVMNQPFKFETPSLLTDSYPRPIWLWLSLLILLTAAIYFYQPAWLGFLPNWLRAIVEGLTAAPTVLPVEADSAPLAPAARPGVTTPAPPSAGGSETRPDNVTPLPPQAARPLALRQNFEVSASMTNASPSDHPTSLRLAHVEIKLNVPEGTFIEFTVEVSPDSDMPIVRHKVHAAPDISAPVMAISASQTSVSIEAAQPVSAPTPEPQLAATLTASASVASPPAPVVVEMPPPAPVAIPQPAWPAPAPTVAPTPVAPRPTPAPTFQLPDLARYAQQLEKRVPLLQNGLVVGTVALGLAVLSQNSFSAKNAFTEMGGWYWAAAAIAFAWAAWLNARSILSATPSANLLGDFTADKRRRNILIGLLVLAGLGSLWTLRDLNAAQPPTSYTGDLLRWLIAIFCVGVAAWLAQSRSLPTLADWRAWAQTNVRLILVVTAIVVAAFLLRVWNVGHIPYVLGGDEGEQGAEILNVLNGTLRNPFSTGWYSVPTLSFFLNALSVRLFGNTIFGLRIMWVLVGTASVLVTFLLVKHLKGTRLALLAAVLLAAYHYHIHFSRLGSNQIADTLLLPLALLFLYRGYDRGSWLDWALCGLSLGLGQYFYAGARLGLVVTAFLVLYLFVRDGFKFSRQNWVGLGVLVLALLVAGGPIFLYAYQRPDDYNARVNQIGIFQNGWLVNEAKVLGKPQSAVLVDQFWRSALAFNAYPDRTAWYGLSGPLLDFTSGVLFLLGLGGTTLLSLRDRRLAPCVAWWWGAILTGGMLTDTTPSSQRFITAAVPVMFCVAWSLDQIAEFLRARFNARVATSVAALAALGLGAMSVNAYFTEYTPKRIYGGEHALIATLLSEKVTTQLGPEWNLYFFGAPRMYIGIGTLRYLLPDLAGQDITDPLTAPFDSTLVPPGAKAFFVFLPERGPELNWVQQTYPNGQVEEVRSPSDQQKILYLTYAVDNPNSGGVALPVATLVPAVSPPLPQSAATRAAYPSSTALAPLVTPEASPATSAYPAP